MRLLQYVDDKGSRVARVEESGLVTPLARFESMYQPGISRRP
jgi:hypothetical protein